jgi:hypothetical protein
MEKTYHLSLDPITDKQGLQDQVNAPIKNTA